ncbi:cvnh domain-containing protein [Colletotrichum plurivorum]|uniref:Cvnh domain-containing protein n=1 Tax=Colletotrichum plurivorum TaxID=2175906 RepID=A0A8H6NCU5_9PEZI|nr:cvnh domain-containing protein [Colletotrichum plurivorum]
MVKSLVNLALALGLLAATAVASPVASPQDSVPATAVLVPAEGIPIPDLVLYPPGYNKTEGDIEARGYAGTCRQCTLTNGGAGADLYCQCTNIAGNLRDSFYDLNRCIGNSNGNLAWWINGGFGGSCNSAKVGGTTLSANCRTTSGAVRSTSINLDVHLQNWDGAIGCDF